MANTIRLSTGDEFNTSDYDLGNYIKRTFEDLVHARQTTDHIRFDNLAWLYGHHWVQWNTHLRLYDNYLLSATDNRIRLKVNKLRSIMQARAAFIRGGTPSIFVDNASPETADKNAALTAQRVARADWVGGDMDDKTEAAWEWTKGCGMGFLQIYMNYGKGKYLGKSKSSGQKVFSGEVDARVRCPLEMVWDPLARGDWDEVRFVIGASVMSRENAFAQFPGLKSDDLKDDKSGYTAVSLYDQYLQLNAPEMSALLDIKDREGRKRNVLILEYWEKPSPKYPEGRYVVTCHKKVVKQTPLEVGEIPIVPFFDLKEAGKIAADTPVTDMRPLQEHLNRTISLDLERSQMPDIYAFPMAGGWKTKWGTKAVITGKYNPTMGAPQIVQGGIQRQDYLVKMEYLERQMENIGGVSQLATRQKTSGGMSGRLGYIVNEANRELLQDISDRYKRSVQKAIRLRLKFIQKYYDEERTMSFINEYDRREIVQFKGKTIHGNYSIRVRLTGNMEDPAARSQRLLQLTQNQLIVQEVFNRGALNKLVAGIDAELGHELLVAETDVDVAQGENFEMSKGALPPIHWYDDHRIHLEEHVRQIKSDETRMWQPEFRANLEQHAMAHKYRMENEQLSQLMKLQQLQGGAGAPKGQRGAAPLAGGPSNPVEAIDQINEMRTKAAYPGATPAQQQGGM